MTDKGIFPLIFITGDKSQLNDADSSRPRWSHKLPMISTFAQQAQLCGIIFAAEFTSRIPGSLEED